MNEEMQVDAGCQHSWSTLVTTNVGGVDVVTASRNELVQAWTADCARKTGGKITIGRLVFDLNGHALSLRETDEAYRANLQRADIIHADGGFIVSVSRMRAINPIKERSATTDMIHDFAKAAEAEGLTFYLFGGTEDVNASAEKKLLELYPALKIVGRRNGYYHPQEEGGIVADIARTSPDILWVGLGKPKEQDFAVRNAAELNSSWIVTCGGCFNYITGAYTRAPEWMQRSNLEWLHRLITNPRQLAWRYLVTTPHALWLALSKYSKG